MDNNAKYIDQLEQALNDAVGLLMKAELKLAEAELELANEKQRNKNQANEILHLLHMVAALREENHILGEELTGGA